MLESRVNIKLYSVFEFFQEYTFAPIVTTSFNEKKKEKSNERVTL